LKAPYTQLFIFIVENLNDFISTVNGLELNFLTAATLAGIALSSVRVVMLTLTQGTPFDGFILPVIDPKQLNFDFKL